MIQAINISKSYGDLVLYEKLSFSIDHGQRIALIAKNGAGKSTLLDIIAGIDTPDSGSVVLRNDLSVGYLHQEPQLPDDKNVMEAIYHTDSETMQAIKSYEQALINGHADAISKAALAMDKQQAWNIEHKIKSILTQLKITEFDQPVATLSGGQRKRLALAIVLIDQYDVLILDEPTNHLDLEMSKWLENYLVSCGKTLFMVTHDRYFLDNVCTDIYELDHQQMFQYKGAYGDYLSQKQARIQQFNSEVEKAQNLYRKELDWMRRMPQARGTKAKYRKDAFYDLQDKAFEKRNDKDVEIRTATQRIGKKIFEVHHLSKNYGNKIILSDFSYTFSRYEKLGIIGKNGVGKSTFLNILTGTITPDQGNIEIGSTIRFGYYTQNGMSFDENARVIDIARDIAEVVTLGDGSTITVSQFLTHFLFAPETQYGQVSKLSGGERRRLYLLTILMQSPNFLILDEPTNDLDIMTLNILEEYLDNFGGCLMVVSHDRYFMDKVVDHLMVFEGDGRITLFEGNYTQYRNSLADKEEKEKQERLENGSNKDIAPNTRTQLRSKKMSYQQQKEFESLEKEISILEQQKKTLEAQLSVGRSDNIIQLSEDYASITTTLEEKSFRWLELADEFNL